MCGIAGGRQLSDDQLSRMTSALRHRGPDGVGHYHSGTVSLGMTRLAIMDLAHGNQPFVSPDGRVHAICNGEIYNWRTLRQELEQCGHHFQTQCDCEIIPAAWIEWGEGMFGRFNGMFAIAIFDQADSTLILARDRCGQKPLYLTESGPLRFASEIKALAAAGVSLTPDTTHLSDWLSLRYVPEPATLFKNISTLPAAHWMRVDSDGNQQTTRYWQPPQVDVQASQYSKAGSVDRAVDELDQLARSSVELALQADVPLAAYLSGGVDSSLLAHYVRDLGADIATVSIGFGTDSDETRVAQETARTLGLKHHPTSLSPEALHDLPRVIHQMDRPVGDALILAFDRLASHTAGLGCKVALGGEGPDEHFAGYSFHKAYLRALQLGHHGRRITSSLLEMAPSWVIDRMAAFPAKLGPEGRHKIAAYLKNFDRLGSYERVTALHTLFAHEEISQLLSADLRASQEPNRQNHGGIQEGLDFALRSQYQSWLPAWSLIRQDKNSMAHALEYRAPFLDHRIIDFAFSLPDHYKIRRGNDKWIWRQLAARHLPPTITKRPKQPFYLPLEHPDWRKTLIELAHDVLAPGNYSCHGWLNPDKVKDLLEATTFLPLKQLASIVVLQLWSDSFSHSTP